MKRFLKLVYRKVFPEHYLYVVHNSKEYAIHVKKFKKISPTKISGYNKDGEYFEIFNSTPMNYYIEEYRDDLQ